MEMKKLIWVLVAVLLGVGISLNPAEGKGSKTGGSLKGKLSVTAPPRKVITASSDEEGQDEYGYSKTSTPTHSLPEQVVIYLKRVPGTFTPPKKHAQLDQSHRDFTRRVLPVLKGTVVDFTNHDTVWHNVFTNSQINKFDLGRKKNGQTVSKKMMHSEIPVKVYCDIHSAMRSYILVLDNPYFTTVGPDQTFEIDGVPPGTYTMVAWHDYWQTVEKKVTIKKGKTTRADVVLDKVAN